MKHAVAAHLGESCKRVPDLGEHNRHVLTELLGLSRETFEALESEGVIRQERGS